MTENVLYTTVQFVRWILPPKTNQRLRVFSCLCSKLTTDTDCSKLTTTDCSKQTTVKRETPFHSSQLWFLAILKTELLWTSLSFKDVGDPLSVTPPIAEKESVEECGIGKARDFCVHSSSRHTYRLKLIRYWSSPLSSLSPGSGTRPSPRIVGLSPVRMTQ
jgi:hypothetical protein